MVGLAGLSTVYPGFLGARKAELGNQQQGLNIQQLLDEQAGQTAFGNTLKLFAGDQQGPQPPAPGQPSTPSAPPMPQPVPGAQPMPPQQQGPPPPMPNMTGPALPQQAPQQPPNFAQRFDASAGPTGVEPQQAPPPMQQQGPAPQPGQASTPQQPSGHLDWKQVAQLVAKANPGASPQVIASAVSKFLPLMTQQSQMDWKTVMAQTAQQRAQTGTDESLRKTKQGDTRNDLRAQGLELTGKDLENKGRNRDVGTDLRRDKLGLDQAREARIAEMAKIRQDQTMQRLAIAQQNLERQIQQGGARQNLAEWRANIDAQHKRAMEIIQAAGLAGTGMDANVKKGLIADADRMRDAAIMRMRDVTGRSTPQGTQPAPVPGQPKANERVPAPTRATPGVPAATLPPDALKALQGAPPGTKLKMGNQSWQLGPDGQPVPAP